jgi:hypothetical protein
MFVLCTNKLNIDSLYSSYVVKQSFGQQLNPILHTRKSHTNTNQHLLDTFINIFIEAERLNRGSG